MESKQFNNFSFNPSQDVACDTSKKDSEGMDKGHRGLLTLVKRRNSLTSFNQSEIRRNIGTKGPNKGLHNAQKQLAKSLGSLANDAPFFLALKPFKHRVAVTDRDGDFTYEELFKR